MTRAAMILSKAFVAGGLLAILSGIIDSGIGLAQKPHEPFGFAQVEGFAAGLAAKPYSPPAKIPDFLKQIDYDHWRDIRFQTERSLWRSEKLPFEVQFFHPGFLYVEPVKVSIVDPQGVQPLAYSPDMFNFGMNAFDGKIPADLGFAGFRLHHPINTPNYYDEVIAFLGASYFRAVSKDQRYGISARGLAIDVAEQKGEEFPSFREFWLVKPQPGDRSFTLYALLDSTSLSGAYKFVIEPGIQTRVHVRMSLYRRQEVKKLGLAPMTSMFLYGENQNIRGDDFRTEVHDSDGLLIGSGSGEWIWRPLRNPKTLLISNYTAERFKGFGLLQRDMNFDHYQDLEAFYQLRPSIWITMEGEWGPGRVELVELPTNTEINDNIIAYWVPRDMPERGHPISLAYRMNWYFPEEDRHEKGWVLATRTSVLEGGKRRFLIDFKGGQLERLNNAMALEPVVSIPKGARIVDQQLQKNPYADSWRLVFTVVPAEKELLDKVMANSDNTMHFRAFLRQEGNAVTETWSYRFEP